MNKFEKFKETLDLLGVCYEQMSKNSLIICAPCFYETEDEQIIGFVDDEQPIVVEYKNDHLDWSIPITQYNT